MVPVLLDTGSTGLVMDSQFLTQNFGPVIGTGTAGYAGGLTYNYNTYSTTVDFGNGLLTLPTSVNVVTSSSPGTLGNFLSRSGAVGVLGIGPNNGFPGTSSIVTAMPGLLNNGVLIDESAGILQFGPNTLTGGITISGAPISTVAVQIDNGPLQQAPVMFDSGGINGTIPSALASLPSTGIRAGGNDHFGLHQRRPDAVVLLHHHRDKHPICHLRRRDEHRARPLRAATDIRLLQPHRHRDDHL